MRRKIRDATTGANLFGAREQAMRWLLPALSLSCATGAGPRRSAHPGQRGAAGISRGPGARGGRRRDAAARGRAGAPHSPRTEHALHDDGPGDARTSPWWRRRIAEGGLALTVMRDREFTLSFPPASPAADGPNQNPWVRIVRGGFCLFLACRRISASGVHAEHCRDSSFFATKSLTGRGRPFEPGCATFQRLP
jgi:hypothetical protein